MNGENIMEGDVTMREQERKEEIDKFLAESGVTEYVEDFVFDKCKYLTVMGSRAYGTNHEDSDYDAVGFCIPSPQILYPQDYGYVPGFSKKIPTFDQFHFETKKDVVGEKMDVTIYNIVRFFRLLTDNNPNILETLYTNEEDDVLVQSKISSELRQNRDLFLSKQIHIKFAGYAHQCITKMVASPKNTVGKRKALVEKFGYDTKYAAHAVRLIYQAHDLFETGTMDLKKHCVAIKEVLDGKWSMKDVEEIVNDGLDIQEDLYAKSSLPETPNEVPIIMMLRRFIENDI